MPQQYAKRILITNHHTKFEPDSSKRLKVYPSWDRRHTHAHRRAHADPHIHDTHPGWNIVKNFVGYNRAKQNYPGCCNPNSDSLIVGTWSQKGAVVVGFHHSHPLSMPCKRLHAIAEREIILKIVDPKYKASCAHFYCIFPHQKRSHVLRYSPKFLLLT